MNNYDIRVFMRHIEKAFPEGIISNCIGDGINRVTVKVYFGTNTIFNFYYCEGTTVYGASALDIITRKQTMDYLNSFCLPTLIQEVIHEINREGI